MSEKTPINSDDPSTNEDRTHNGARRCTSKSNGTGERCKAPAIDGANVCRSHGGSAPQVRAAARQRLLKASDPVAAALIEIATDQSQPAAARVSAANSVLDRAGVPKETRHLVEDALDADIRKLAEELGVENHPAVAAYLAEQ